MRGIEKGIVKPNLVEGLLGERNVHRFTLYQQKGVSLPISDQNIKSFLSISVPQTSLYLHER